MLNVFNRVSEKEVSVRRSQPSPRAGEPRKSSLDRTALLKLCEKNTRKERGSLQAVSLQGTLEFLILERSTPVGTRRS